MITIEITGPRGEGKTTTAMALVQYLRSLGFPVTFESCTRQREMAVEGQLARPVDAERAMTLPREYTVVDRQ